MLNGLLAGTEGDFVEHGLTPVLNHLGQLNAWRAAAQRFNRPLDAVIHIDTGMNRLGFGPEDTQALINERGRLRGLRLALIMSHLVASEEPSQPDQRRAALALPQLRAGRCRARRRRWPIRRASSSGPTIISTCCGRARRSTASIPCPASPIPMLPVVTLQARILQTRRIDALQTVGYGGAWRSARPSRVATIALGYADGYFRTLINRTHVHLAGHRVPVIGRISMDLVTIDVTDVPRPNARSARRSRCWART